MARYRQWNTSSRQKKITYTDKNGYFEIQFKGTHSAFFGLAKAKYEWGNSEYKSYGGGVHENELFEMKAEAWFEPILKSKETSYDKDSLYIEHLTNKLSPYDIEMGNKYGDTGFHRLYLGKGVIEFNYWRTVGDTYMIYRTTLRRQNTVKIKVDSVFIKSFETYKDTIYY